MAEEEEQTYNTKIPTALQGALAVGMDPYPTRLFAQTPSSTLCFSVTPFHIWAKDLTLRLDQEDMDIALPKP